MFAKEAKRRMVLWGVTPEGAETASATVEIATATGFDVRAWDGAVSSADPSDGKVTLALTGSPVLLVER